MAFVTIPSTSVDAKSPLDDLLMGQIKQDLDDLDSRVITAGASPFIFEVEGKLTYTAYWKRSLATSILNSDMAPSTCRYMLKKSGSTALTFDIRKKTSPKTAIQSVLHQFTDSTTGIARVGTALPTQSIARATPQISTQSITHAKAAVNVQSIIGLGTVDGLGSNLWQYNLATALDSDTLVGDSIVFASCTSGANNGTFVLVEVGRGGDKNVVVTNASGVAQTGVAGTAQVKIMSYNFTNPVNALFVAGYTALFAAHTSGVNDGSLTIYAINSSGNNIWAKNPTGATQGGAAGNANTGLWTFTYTSAVSTTNYVVGEKANTASHTSALNDGNFFIWLVNSGGNNLILHNPVGVAQAGVAGNTASNHWKYTFASDPSANVSAGYTVYMTGHTNPLNDGTFTVSDVNNGGGNNIAVYNLSGVAQAATPGTVNTTRKVVSFLTDQSANYTTLSFVELQGCVDRLYNYADFFAPLQVVQVNRGGGANYNIVLEMPTGRASAPSQLSPAGYVQTEMKSIFSAAPSLAASLTGLEPNQDVVGVSTAMVVATVTAQTPLQLYITSYPSGDPQGFTAILR